MIEFTDGESSRFWVKVDKRPDGCWVWTGFRMWYGHGRLTFRGKQEYAHRIAYRVLVGEIPDGKELDHLCRNPPCVNPAHLEPVTHRVNTQRGDAGKWMRDRTHCANGHEFTPENTRVTSKRRHCRTCARNYTRAYRERRAAVASC